MIFQQSILPTSWTIEITLIVAQIYRKNSFFVCLYLNWKKFANRIKNWNRTSDSLVFSFSSMNLALWCFLFLHAVDKDKSWFLFTQFYFFNHSYWLKSFCFKICIETNKFCFCNCLDLPWEKFFTDPSTKFQKLRILIFFFTNYFS